jgi:hypothetical protein
MVQLHHKTTLTWSNTTSPVLRGVVGDRLRREDARDLPGIKCGVEDKDGVLDELVGVLHHATVCQLNIHESGKEKHNRTKTNGRSANLCKVAAPLVIGIEAFNTWGI